MLSLCITQGFPGIMLLFLQLGVFITLASDIIELLSIKNLN